MCRRVRRVPKGCILLEPHVCSSQKRALDIIKGKLLVVAQEQQAAEIAGIRGDQVKAEWGQQIRNYVEHPYKLVKDLRTEVETSNVSGVLDGDLDAFVEALLLQKGQRSSDA